LIYKEILMNRISTGAYSITQIGNWNNSSFNVLKKFKYEVTWRKFNAGLATGNRPL